MRIEHETLTRSQMPSASSSLLQTFERFGSLMITSTSSDFQSRLRLLWKGDRRCMCEMKTQAGGFIVFSTRLCEVHHRRYKLMHSFSIRFHVSFSRSPTTFAACDTIPLVSSSSSSSTLKTCSRDDHNAHLSRVRPSLRGHRSVCIARALPQ